MTMDKLSCESTIELVVHISYPTRSGGIMQTPKCELITTFILLHLCILSNQEWCDPNGIT